MNIAHQPTDFADQAAKHADKLAQAVGAMSDKVDVQDLRDRAEAGAADLLGAATDDRGKPRRGLLVGAAVVLALLLVARRLLR